MLARQLRNEAPPIASNCLPVIDPARPKNGKCEMSANEKAMRSGSAAIVFFAALSSVSAIATALLPMLIA
jgi:hypothetical protein